MRARFPVTVHLFFVSGDKVLLLRRANTGWEDGKYSVPAGHIEADESVTQAALREAQEEVGVRLEPATTQVVHVMQRRSDDVRVDFFLLPRAWDNEITNNEPEKCDDLRWFPKSELPSNLITYVRHALENYSHGVFFSEYGWQD